MGAYLYPLSLAIISVFVMAAERLWPLRAQRQLRPGLASDLVHLVFNGHFLGVILYGIAEHRILPTVGPWLGNLPKNLAGSWPLYVQIPVALLLIDFMDWCVHNLLHRVPGLWALHQTHHSVVDGEMDWIVAFRFQWTEVVLYKTLRYLPMLILGFGVEAIMVHAIFGTLIGHLNHANLDLGHGPWRFVLNSPRMHLWHHNYHADAKSTVNYGIIFSIWDWVFKTAYMPDAPPAKIGFSSVERFPKNFFAQASWPLPGLLKLAKPSGLFACVVGGLVLLLGWWLHLP